MNSLATRYKVKFSLGRVALAGYAKIVTKLYTVISEMDKKRPKKRLDMAFIWCIFTPKGTR